MRLKGFGNRLPKSVTDYWVSGNWLPEYSNRLLTACNLKIMSFLPFFQYVSLVIDHNAITKVSNMYIR